jgi:hypothetical protein
MFILMLLGETLNSLLFVSGSLFIVAVMKNILILKGCRHLFEKGAAIRSDFGIVFTDICEVIFCDCYHERTGLIVEKALYRTLG